LLEHHINFKQWVKEGSRPPERFLFLKQIIESKYPEYLV